MFYFPLLWVSPVFYQTAVYVLAAVLVCMAGGFFRKRKAAANA